jgi:hypothetical protein
MVVQEARPFAAAQGDSHGRPQASPVWLRLVREWHEEAAKHLSAQAARSFAVAQGDAVRYRRVMLIGRPTGETGRG